MAVVVDDGEGPCPECEAPRKSFLFSHNKVTLKDQAGAAYEAAVTYQRWVLKKWEPRDAELRRKDEFNRTRIAWENDSYRAEMLRKLTGDLLLAVVRGTPQSYTAMVRYLGYAGLFANKDRHFVKAYKAYKLVLEMIDA